MFGASVLAALAVGLGGQSAPQVATPAPAPQTQTVQTQTGTTPADPTAVTVDDVVVEGRRLDEAARSFVNAVAAPAGPRGLARWNGKVCVGMANLKADVAQYVVDRVSDVAVGLGIAVGEPGCTPNVLIIATADGPGLAAGLVAAKPKAFDHGSTQMEQGDRALAAFKTSDKPVRWWQVSMPVDSNTGLRAIRLPGDVDPSTGEPSAPVINLSGGASRLTNQIRDDMYQSIIIVDIERLGAVSYPQLADYLAMVALAQIDPDAKIEGYDSILNLFQDRVGTTGLTAWDQAYLKALYTAEQNRVNPRSQAGAVAGLIVRDRREASANAQ